MPKPSAESPELPGYLPKTDPRRQCVNCQRAMAPQPHMLETRVADYGTRPDGTKWSGWHTEYTIMRITGYGYRAEGIFCSLRCGHAYGKRRHLADVAKARMDAERQTGYRA